MRCACAATTDTCASASASSVIGPRTARSTQPRGASGAARAPSLEVRRDTELRAQCTNDVEMLEVVVLARHLCALSEPKRAHRSLV